MGPIGIPELIILSVVVVLPASFLIGFGRRARRHGYPSVGAYLRAAPRTDAERRDAVGLMLSGVVICGLALIFPPLVLIGLVPLYFGGRKLFYASLGLGLVDDAEQPGR